MVNWALRALGQRTRWDRRKADPQVGHGGDSLVALHRHRMMERLRERDGTSSRQASMAERVRHSGRMYLVNMEGEQEKAWRRFS